MEQGIVMPNVPTILNLLPERQILMDGYQAPMILTQVQVCMDHVVLNLIYGRPTHSAKHSLHILVQQLVHTRA